MRFALLPALFFAGTLVLPAQTTGMPILPRPEAAYERLKAYLSLSDPQVLALVQVRQRQTDAETAIYNQIAERERTLYGLLDGGSTDALRIGQLTVEINQLRKQLPLSGAPYHTDALAVLTADQKTRLTTLVTALQLQDAGWQAVFLNLIDNPNGDVHILPLSSSAGGIVTASAAACNGIPAGPFHTNMPILTRSAGTQQ